MYRNFKIEILRLRLRMTKVAVTLSVAKSLTWMNIKKILVIKLKNIGDVVLATPALRALRKSFPNAHVAILVRKGTEEVLAGLPYIDEIIELDIDGAHSIRHMGGNIRFLYDLRKKGFDLSIDLSGGGDRGAALSFFSGAPIRVG